LAIEEAIRPLPFAWSTRHFAPARHLASGLSRNQHSPMRISALAMVRRDRQRGCVLAAPIATPSLGEEIVRWTIWHDDCQLATLPS